MKRRKDRKRKNIARHMIWFRSAVFIDVLHPFLFGIFRIKGRKRRSPKFPTELIPIYYCRRTWDIASWVVRTLLMVVELRYLYYKVNRKKNKDYVDITITPEPPLKKDVLSKDTSTS